MSEQDVFGSRRNYNRWVANETLEDYALRFTAKSARRWSAARVSNTALGAISFLALEAIGGVITLQYGFYNAVIAIMVVSLVIFLTGLPISYYAARYGVDIDLLSRGAGFGYIGSTITSLIYASFTFIFFALEAAIMSSALEMLFAIPLSVGYLLSSLIVIPLATHGITFISRFQLWSQPLWLSLQLLPFVFILYQEWSTVEQWTQYKSAASENSSGFNVIFFGAASGVLFSLMAQIGEQVDFLRFLPEQQKNNRPRWWIALLAAGPGWILVGVMKILAGSFLAVLAVNHGVSPDRADDPTQMYLVAFGYMTQSPLVALSLAGIFVIVCQLKINVTNAYAGSIAWSNFFSRLTHSHPGRVVWLVFNVIIALMLMELGVYDALERILAIYSNVAVAWVGALVADLVINKPLGYSPRHIEFKRAHLFDINPVGFGAMIVASTTGILSYIGLFGQLAQALSPYISLVTAFIVSPLIAIITKGRYYIAREAGLLATDTGIVKCKICDNAFEVEDMTSCPAYDGAICSLCCSIDSRCHDQCKVGARFNDQLTQFVAAILPRRIALHMDARVLQFFGLLTLIATVIALLFLLVYQQVPVYKGEIKEVLSSTLIQVFILLMIIVGVLVWLFVLANESRQFALEESQRQTKLLSKEIHAHERTDLALQNAKEVAESANQAKSRYLTGISHELRSPLNTILGYAQLLEKDDRLMSDQRNKLSLIRRSGDHLADLIEGLLDISRIEAGRLELSRDQVSLQGMIDELIDMFRLQAQAKGIEFEYIARSYLPEAVIVDEKHLRQILINLLSNAVKYTLDGCISFSVHYRNQVAEFTIKDTGIGIAADEMELIFHPFERIRKPGIKQSPGTGLGLTISKFLTEIMGGEITLDSEPDKGSTFKLSLMLPSVNTPMVRAEPARRIESYQGEPKTVMVVDDDASHRSFICETLKPLGFVVFEAADAYECLNAVSLDEMDLFLLDISMPGMNGWNLLAELRKQGIKVPIMMVSADAIEGPEYARQQHDSAPLNDDYLTKPIRYNVLLDKLANLLDLQWTYEANIHDVDQLPDIQADVRSLQADVTANDCRELMSMAELGFIDGLEKTLGRMERHYQGSEFIKVLKHHAGQYQFEEIISLCRKAL